MNNAYLVIWEFQVKPEARSVFEDVYGPEGAWARLFRRSADYGGTKLIRDQSRPERYLTLDFWTSREALERFKQEHGAEYTSLDKQCESLTKREMIIGEFGAVG